MEHGAEAEFIKRNNTCCKISRLNAEPRVNLPVRRVSQGFAQDISVEEDHETSLAFLLFTRERIFWILFPTQVTN